MQSESSNTTTATAQAAEFIPVTLWPHPWPTPGSWRALIFAAPPRDRSIHRPRAAAYHFVGRGALDHERGQTYIEPPPGPPDP